MRGRRAAAFSALAAATALLFVISRGKWSDAIIDSGREWIVPDALSRGALLYRDVVYWFGPFTPYFQAGFLGLFGSGFAALVLAGAVAALGVLAALFSTLVRVTGRKDAGLWTALAVPALLFMPNAGGAFLGMGYRIWQAAGFTLASVAVASSGGGSRRPTRAVVAGALAGLAGLCRTEWGMAAMLATGLAAILRPRARARGAAEALLAASGFAAVFGGGLALFLWLAGPQAVVGDGHVLLTGLPEETRHFLVAFSGVADWKRGVLELFYSAAMWTGLFLLAARLSVPAGTRARGLEVALVAILVVLVATALAGGAGGAVIFSAAPLVSFAALAGGLWRRRGSAAAALAASGVLGVLLSYRRPFHIGDSAYVGPPLLFAFVSSAGLLRLAVAYRRRLPGIHGLRAAFRWVIAALLLLAFAGRAWQYSSLEGVPIAGTSKMLSARPEVAREVEQLGSRIRQSTREGEGLVVFPEGELLNLLAERPNPIRHKLYLPGYLTDGNEADVLRELESARPAAIVLWRRPVPEYGRALFGEDYGRSLRAWIEREYRLEPFRADGAPNRTHPAFLLGLRRRSPGSLGSAREMGYPSE